MFIDTHCHLAFEDNIDKIISDCNKNDVLYLILGSSSLEDNDENIKICLSYNNVYTSLGYHPEFADKITKNDIESLYEKCKNSKVVAIGEIGLDYHYGKEYRNEQIELFEEQLKLAEKFNLPVIIHSRDATFDTINTLKKFNVTGLIHCFSGSLETAKEYINMGFLLGIGGVVTFKNSNLSNVLKEIDLDKIVLETDSPYLSPFRGEKNSPSNIPVIASFIANIYNVSIQNVADITTNNVKKMFKINIKD